MSDDFFDQVIKDREAAQKQGTNSTAHRTTTKPNVPAKTATRTNTPPAKKTTSARPVASKPATTIPRVQAGRTQARVSTLITSNMQPRIHANMKPVTVKAKEHLTTICPTDHEAYDPDLIVDTSSLTPLQAALVFGEVLNSPKYRKR